MFLHKRGKKIVALMLAIAIVLSGVSFVFDSESGGGVRFGQNNTASAAAYSTWVQKASGATPRYNQVSVAINGKMYVFGGDSGFQYNHDLWEYNPVTDTWLQKATCPATLVGPCAAVVDGKMYVNSYRDFYVYDPATDKWTILSACPKISSGGRSMASVNGKIYIFGGNYSGDYITSDLWEYDPQSTIWTNKANSPVPLVNQTAVGINGKMYVYGGQTGDKDWRITGCLMEYDPLTNKWTTKPYGPASRKHSAVVINEKMYVCGGLYNDVYVKGMHEYDPATNKWIQMADAPFVVGDNSAAAINNKIYVFGSANGHGMTNSLWECSISTPPSYTVNSPSDNMTFSEKDTGFIPRITISDIDNDTLSCRYYIDSETAPRDTKTLTNTLAAQTVNFNSLDMSTLSEGTHTIRFEADDIGITTPATKTVSFDLDKSYPVMGAVTVSTTTNTVTILGSATDSFTGMDSNPYRYTIGSEVSPWGNATTYTSQNNLISNMMYEAKFEARDTVGHISTSSQNVYTKADVPDLAVNNASSYTLDVSTSDNNSDSTQYQISTNNSSQYVTQEGTLTAAPAWITLINKKVTVTGLSPEQTYTFTAKARNSENIETVASSSVSGTTLIAPPGSPANIIATATDKTITVSWDASSGAIGYEIEVDGTVVNTDTATVYTHVGINSGTPHTYRVRAKNAGGPGNWSAPITKSTLPASPDIPVNLNAVPLSTSVTVTWNNVSGATGYDIEVDGALVNNGPNTNYIHNSLTPGTHHTYRVRSINPGGKSEWSGYVNTTTLLDTVPVPINISATPSLNSIALTWDKVGGASGYEISVDGVAFDNGTRTTYTHSNLALGTQHVYRVRAKKSGVASEWSAAVVSATLTNEFGTPSNLKANADNSSIVLSWKPVANATGYEVEVDGVVTDNGDETTCINNGLLPNTTHTYRVRAKRDTEVSEWTEPLTANTFLLQTPKELTANSDETSMTINWQPIEGATGYELDFDGSVITGISETTYLAGGLEQNSQHEIKVRAVSEGGTSNWSNALIKSTKFTSGNVPKVSAIAKKTSISVMWNKIDGATSYDVEADGVVTSNVNALTYTSKGLQAGTKHTYRVRANNSSGAGDWGSVFTVSTLPQGPVIPSNVVSSSNMTSILISWDKVTGAEEYEIEVDGLIIDNGTGTSYLHKGLSPDTTHTYKVRARSVSGISEWSTPMIIKTLNSVQTYDITSSAGEEFDLILSGSDIQDLNKYTFSIQYDTKDFDLIDLCGFTPKTDTQEGDIYGTDITVKQVAPGTIVFVKKGSAQSWQVWSGIVNSIRLRAKHDGPAEITYTIQ